MANSLADQLLKAGLVDGKKVKQASKEKKKQQKKNFKNRSSVPDENRLAAQQALAAKQQLSREKNQQKESKSQARAIAAQIRQLIESNALAVEGDIAFNFVDTGTVKKMYINEKIQGSLVKGTLAIVRSGLAYKVVPFAVADKIAQRDASFVLLKNDKSIAEAEDEYADFKVPDDLMW